MTPCPSVSSYRRCVGVCFYIRAYVSVWTASTLTMTAGISSDTLVTV